MRNLWLDVGHSQRFQGAIGIKREVDFVRAVMRELEPMLDRSKWRVIKVPDDYGWRDYRSSNMNIRNRVSFINRACRDGDWVLSVHSNAAANKDVRGVTTCHMGGSLYAERKAREMSRTMKEATGVPVWGDGSFDDRTGRWGRIALVRDTRPMALLVECGFCTNLQDMGVSPQAYAIGIAKFINQQ